MSAPDTEEIDPVDGELWPRDIENHRRLIRERDNRLRTLHDQLDHTKSQLAEAAMNVANGKNGIKILCSQSSLEKAIWAGRLDDE